MTIHVDDYSIVNVHYIVHAVPVDPCDEHGGKPEDNDWLIGLILHVGHQAFQVAQGYPTRERRDAAFEAIAALIQCQQRQAVEDDEDAE